MDDEQPPSRTSASQPHTLSQTHSTSEASDDAIASPHLARRSHSDSASATLERQLRNRGGSNRGHREREPIPLAGETWKDFIRDTVAEAGPSSSSRAAAGPSVVTDGFVRPGLRPSSLSGPAAQRGRIWRAESEQSRASLGFQDQQDQALRRGLVHSRSDPDSAAVASRSRNKAPAQGRPRPLDPQEIESWKSIIGIEGMRQQLHALNDREERNNRRKRNQSTQVEESYINKRAAVTGVGSDMVPSNSTSNHTSPVRDQASRQPAPHLPQGQVQTRNPTTSPRRQSGSNIVLPPWQPDSEVESCTICNTPFSLWYRRHHCRKCGRVVCSSCSPHRITIPRQFVVQPPGNAADLAAAGLAARFAESGFNLSYGGAEVVRVCNPCVPDPNFGPPPQLTSPVTSPRFGPSAAVAGNASRNPQSTGSLFTSTTTQPTSQAPHPGPFSAYQFLQQGLHVPVSRSSSLAVPGATSASRHNNVASAIASSAPQHRHSVPNPLHPRHAPPAPPPLLRPTRPTIREEDECPVCGLELPPRGPSGDETAREQHVIDCISSFSAPQPSASSVVIGPADAPVATEVVSIAPSQPIPTAVETTIGESGGSVPDTATAVTIPRRAASVSQPRAIAIASSSSSSHTTARASLPLSSTPLSSSHPHSHRPRQPSTASPSAALPTPLPHRPPHPHHPARMLIYHATEKDCVDLSTGGAQECVICFEEFEEGDEMARLECLCKFHRRCIRGWWEMKGGGMCPTHQVGVWG